jgi:glycerol-3-phosphate dehydrogenase
MISRKETFAALKDQPNVSVLIVGGGINGLSTFRELALQGVDVLLVEKSDFSSGASAGSSHMMHGGIRYLENGEFRLVREALTERNRLLQNAPHYVFPQPTIMPIFTWFSGTLNAPLKFLGWSDKPGERGAFIIKIGLMMYDAFASTQKTMPNHRLIGKEEMLRRFPGIDTDIIYAAQYYDGFMPYPERLALEVALDTEKASDKAHALNYTSVIGGEGDTVTLRDELTGDEHTVKPTVVVNAAGPWIDFANDKLGHKTRFIGGTKGSHLVIDHPQLREMLGNNEFFFENTDGRIVLILPLEDRLLVGTTDIRVDDPDDAVCNEDEINYILSLIKHIFPDIEVTRDHVVFTICGVRPLPNQDASTTGQISRDHSIEVVEAGNGTDYPILSLVGGKWTTFRAFGEHVARDVLGRFGMSYDVDSKNLPIGGGANYPQGERDTSKWINSVAAQTGQSVEQIRIWFERYGTGAADVAAFAADEKDMPLENMPSYTQREVVYITRNEKVFTLTDFVLRRSLIAMLGKLTEPLLQELGAIIGKELSWKQTEIKKQVAATLATLRDEHLAVPQAEGNSQLIDVPESVIADANESRTLEPVSGD